MADSEGERCEIFAKTYQHSEEMTTFAMHKEQMNPLGRHRPLERCIRKEEQTDRTNIIINNPKPYITIA